MPLTQQANLYHASSPRFTVGDVLDDESVVYQVGWSTSRPGWWITTQFADGTPHSGGIESMFSSRTIVIRAADNAGTTSPAELQAAPPKAGDTVRLTMKSTRTGVVDKQGSHNRLHVQGYYLDAPGREVEILERAKPPVPPLPTADGYHLGYDRMTLADIVVIVVDGEMYLPDAAKLGGIGGRLGNPERFAPFQKLSITTIGKKGQ